jgi:hypothetical protein
MRGVAEWKISIGDFTEDPSKAKICPPNPTGSNSTHHFFAFFPARSLKSLRLSILGESQPLAARSLIKPV